MNLFLNIFIFFTFILIFPSYASGQITFDANGKWETTFDYPSECAQRGYDDQPNCGTVSNDGIQWNAGAGHRTSSNTYTRAVADANYPGGGGGLGARFWNYDGHNNHSGTVGVYFPSPQKELWIRWYMRYQEGFQWRSSEGGTLHQIAFNKTFIMRTGASGADMVPGVLNGFHLRVQGEPGHSIYFNNGGWDDTFGPGTSDGEWYCFEIYMKMGTSVGSANGIMRWWVNGALKAERTNIVWDNNNSTSHQGWTWFNFNENQSYVSNADGPLGLDYAYIDYDDMVIYNQTPPNVDAHGNPFIGPLPPAPPWGLSIDVQ